MAKINVKGTEIAIISKKLNNPGFKPIEFDGFRKRAESRKDFSP